MLSRRRVLPERTPDISVTVTGALRHGVAQVLYEEAVRLESQQAAARPMSVRFHFLRRQADDLRDLADLIVPGIMLVPIAALALALGLATARAGDLPDPKLTPGAVATSDKAELCGTDGGLTYTKRHRLWDRQRETRAKYGVARGDRRPYQDDDRVPVCLGGDNASPLNHWEQPGFGTAWTYLVKDRLDDTACRLVCAGKVDPKTAQAWFLAPDWRQSYCAVFPHDQLCRPAAGVHATHSRRISKNRRNR